MFGKRSGNDGDTRVVKPAALAPEPPSAPAASQQAAVTEEMTTVGPTIPRKDRIKPRRSDPVIEVRRSAKVQPGPSLRKAVAPRPSAAALKPPPPVAPVPTPLVLDDVFSAHHDAQAHFAAGAGLGATACWCIIDRGGTRRCAG